MRSANNIKAGKAVGIRILAALPAVFFMVMIFRFSMDTGTESSGLSTRVCLWLVERWNRILGGAMSAEAIQAAAGSIEFLIRKCAHVTEYAILTFSFIPFWRVSVGVGEGKTQWLMGVCAFIYACTDELHQRVVSGRSGRFIDVLIDAIGMVIAMGIYLLIRTLVGRHRRRTGRNSESGEE